MIYVIIRNSSTFLWFISMTDIDQTLILCVITSISQCSVGFELSRLIPFLQLHRGVSSFSWFEHMSIFHLIIVLITYHNTLHCYIYLSAVNHLLSHHQTINKIILGQPLKTHAITLRYAINPPLIKNRPSVSYRIWRCPLCLSSETYPKTNITQLVRNEPDQVRFVPTTGSCRSNHHRSVRHEKNHPLNRRKSPAVTNPVTMPAKKQPALDILRLRFIFASPQMMLPLTRPNNFHFTLSRGICGFSQINVGKSPINVVLSLQKLDSASK